MLLRDVLQQQDLRLSMLTGETGLDRRLTQVYTTDLLDSGRYLTGDELVLTGMMWRREPADSERFVTTLSRAGVAALGAGEGLLGPVPADVIEACRRHLVPLFAVPAEVSFRDITDRINTMLWAEREADAIATRNRERGRVSALATGADLTEVWPPDAEAWVLTCTGRVIAGMPLAAGPSLARAFLRAGPLPARHTIGGRRFLLAELPGTGRLGAHFVAATETSGYLDELVQLAALDQAQHTRVKQVERRLAAQLIAQLTALAEPAEVTTALHTCGLRAQDHHMVLIGSLSSGQASDALIEELLYPHPAVVGTHGDLTIAVVPTTDSEGLLAHVRAAAQSLQGGLRADCLAIGASEAAASAATLPAALVSAQHAHTYALQRTGPVRILSSTELASHELLLANVPLAVRRAFTQQLLAPLLAYDSTHQADLISTLRTFLSLDGSWTRCASAMHLHVNTLRYRLQRIESLTGRDLNRFADRVDFYLALRQSDRI
jgi:sugar diacid utilization regulator